ncbi:MAG: hypothetical protein FJZ38_22690 [Candidatus Rokubacteria bacterium]|nr:hypothetical protein [Candidatus Rokubacteria bacterium]
MSLVRKRARRVGAETMNKSRADDELRQLRATVVALREELDRTRVGEDTRVQHALSSAHQEIEGLRRTVQALRDELDRARIDEETRIQQASSASHQEIDGLRRTIQTLRDEMDLAAQRTREERDRLERDWRGRLTEAQSTIVELRATLERRP